MHVLATSKLLKCVTQDRASVCARLAGRVLLAVSLVPRTHTGRAAAESASVRTLPTVISMMGRVHASQDTSESFVSRSVPWERLDRDVPSLASARTVRTAITKRDSAFVTNRVSRDSTATYPAPRDGTGVTVPSLATAATTVAVTRKRGSVSALQGSPEKPAISRVNKANTA